MLRNLILAMLVCVNCFGSTADSMRHGNRKHTMYFSWGYNGEWYTRSNVYVHQPSLGNNYKLNSVDAHDHKGWDDANFLSQPISIPQYNYRLGYVIDEKRGIGVEINFDHTKYIISEPQGVHITGKLSDGNIDTTVTWIDKNGFYYYLNNGANFLLFNITKRWQRFSNKKGTLYIDLTGKAGIGPLIPHVQNAFFGKDNDPHFQLGGWNIGTEGDVKVTFFHRVYLEYGVKGDYARYSGLKIYEGTAHQAFGTLEMILSLGVNWGVGRRWKE